MPVENPSTSRSNNRRKMAWRAFAAMLLFTAGYWFLLPLWFQYFGLPTTWLDIIAESYFWFAMTMAAIILGYMGFTTLPFLGAGGRSSGIAAPPRGKKEETAAAKEEMYEVIDEE